jgi:peroxiredoxin
VIGVAWTGSESDFQGFVDRHGLTFPQLSDDAGDVYDRFGIPYQPAFAAIGVDGSTEILLGPADEAILEMLVENARG